MYGSLCRARRAAKFQIGPYLTPFFSVAGILLAFLLSLYELQIGPYFSLFFPWKPEIQAKPRYRQYQVSPFLSLYWPDLWTKFCPQFASKMSINVSCEVSLTSKFASTYIRRLYKDMSIRPKDFRPKSRVAWKWKINSYIFQCSNTFYFDFI